MTSEVLDKPDLSAAASAFIKDLSLQMRAQDTFNHWEGKPDDVVLGDFILDAAARKALPIIGDPDPDILWRIEIFYAAVGIGIERVTGIMASPIMKMHHEGFGRVLLTAGRLVVINKYLRDVHRFGFDNMEKLAEAGAKLVTEAAEMISKYPDVARA